ncbi:IclR family transcriptional regulator [Snuella sedimenti]|uniref:IclR family transcriptional regulator n=1 Tax=Snuella sedimenti TaxID=2798802 RepID=A0A8J7JCX3_9FLAO|nr:IclR family transcriptional regulator [Snuella sedimenti]MBJ6368629.1 IclR family transcriptional regulator [Snuella sedimenti]
MTKYNSPALDKGLDIIEYLSEQAIDQSQTEIALGVNKKQNEIYRMLVCLEERGYIVKNQVSGKYKLSLKLYYLAHRHPPLYSLRIAALYPMQKLAAFTRQSCHISILNHGEFLIISQCSGPGPVSLSVEVGSKFPLYGSTSGYIILSQLSKEEQLQYLKRDSRFVDLTEKEKSLYFEEIDLIKEKGYLINESQNAKGVIDIGVPIYIPEINVNAVLAVTILSGQLLELLDSDKIINKLFEAVANIYKNLGINNLQKE